MGDRAEGEKRQVKYRYREFYNEERREVTYRNRFISYQVITRETVGVIAASGVGKRGHEHTDMLMHRGYNLGHPLGQGKGYARELGCRLNLLVYLFHRIQDKAGEKHTGKRAGYLA
jgi:hypothetical protein